MTIDQVKRMIRTQCAKAGGQGQWANQNRLSAAYVSDVLNGRREPAGKLLDALGLERVVTFRKMKSRE